MDIDSVLRDELTEPQYDAATAAEPEVLASVEPDGRQRRSWPVNGVRSTRS